MNFLWRQRLRDIVSVISVLTMPVVFVLVFLIVFASDISPNRRTILIEAEASGIDITLLSENNAWLITEATLCIPKSFDRQAEKERSVLCDTRRYEIKTDSEFILKWQKGSRTTVHRTVDGYYEIQLLTPLGDFVEGTRILIAQDHGIHLGTLLFTGLATIGGKQIDGQSKFLIGGRYEARETGILTALTDRVSHIVKSGDLLRGSTTSVVTGHEGEAAAKIHGQITFPASPKREGFNIVLVSEPGNTALKVQYFEGVKASVVRPDWIDSITTSPMLVAFTIILSLLSSLARVFMNALDYLADRKSNSESDDTDVEQAEKN